MARDQPQINIRIPADLRDMLDKAMERSGRSLTAEIVARLEQSLLQSAADPQADAVVRYMLALNAYETRRDTVNRMSKEFERRKRKTEDQHTFVRAAQIELAHMERALVELRSKFNVAIDLEAVVASSR